MEPVERQPAGEKCGKTASIQLFGCLRNSVGEQFSQQYEEAKAAKQFGGRVVTNTAPQYGIHSRRTLLPEGMKDVVVLVSDGVINDIVDSEMVPANCVVHDVGEDVLMPGVVDSHVHVNEPGRTEWEGFETATRAAAAGGITSIVDMPLNSDPVTTTVEALQKKLFSTQDKLWVDCAFWGGVVPGNANALKDMVDRGVRGFKCFLIHSGIDDFPNVTEADLRLAMPTLAACGVPLLVHAELECGDSCEWQHGPRSYRSFLDSRPRRWENEAIKLMINLCREYMCPVHIVHLSSAEAIPLIEQAKRERLPITVETCPHYLTFAAEEIEDGDPRFKCAPPIRERENRELIWKALQDGIIDMVVSDHSPCTPQLKYLTEGDVQKAWGGISSLQFGLSTVWTEARKRGSTIAQVSDWLSGNTARFAKLARKGRLEKGLDADFVIWNPEQMHKIEQSMIHHRHKVTPYDGRVLLGVVNQTFVRGQKVFDRGSFSSNPCGAAILSSDSRPEGSRNRNMCEEAKVQLI